MARRLALWTGIAIMICGLLLLARVPFFFGRADVVGSRLVAIEQARLKLTQTPRTSAALSVTPTVAASSSDALQPGINPIGLLQIPQLQLIAPILEGDGTSVLSVAVGHLATSVLPGGTGLAVLAAHNATWFRHIDRLHKGSLVTIEIPTGRYEFRVMGAEIVKTGTPVANTTFPAIMLETCYPLDALYLTPYRYLVTARLVQYVDQAQSVPHFGSSRTVPGQYVPDAGLSFLPTFAESGIPMGALSYGPGATPTYEESTAPLSAANLMARLFAGFERESAMGDRHALRELVAESLASNPFLNSSLGNIRYESAFNIELTVTHGVLTLATASLAVSVNGHPYQVTLLAQNDNGRLSLERVGIDSV